MSKRSKLALILLFGLFLLAAGVYIFVQPYLAERNAAQPPALPENVQPYAPGPSTGNGGNGKTGSTSVLIPPSTPEQRQLSTLEQKARSTVERIGSGSNSDGFLGYQDAVQDLTVKGQAAMLAEQRAMQNAHPAAGPLYGISTRVVSSHIKNGAYGDAALAATVEAIQRTDAGDPSQPTSTKGKKITVTFVKQSNDAYLIESITWEDQAI